MIILTYAQAPVFPLFAPELFKVLVREVVVGFSSLR